MRSRIKEINPGILRKCREQIGLRLSDVQKKVARIAEIENGEQFPTFRQLSTLSVLYSVPRWVFISEELPDEYRFDESSPAFRQFASQRAEVFEDPRLRRITAKIEKLRALILELLEDMGESRAEPFAPPDIHSNPEVAAEATRSWLTVDETTGGFDFWKRALEQKDVFVFLTSKYPSWSKVDKEAFRGLSIFHEILPIIIINDSDAKKAQAFSLLHELGHLVRKESSLDDWPASNRSTEKWCDQFAGSVLMPRNLVLEQTNESIDLDAIKRLSKQFNVSSYAYLVRIRQLSLITESQYVSIEDDLTAEYLEMRKRNKAKSGVIARNRVKETVDQYGHIYTRVLFSAYHNNEIGLQRLSKLLDLKRPSQALRVQWLI